MKKAGEEILSYCTQCKLDLNHVIIAMKGVIIAKVQCLTCKGEHQYHPKKGASSKKKVAGDSELASSRLSTQSIAQEWQRLMELNRQQPTHPYSMQKSFGIGDKLQHPQFGEGIVQKVIYPNKVDVLFQETLKTLIHGQVVQSTKPELAGFHSAPNKKA